MTHGNTRHQLRYLIRCEHTLRLLAWSPDYKKAVACAHALRARMIPVFVEIAK